MLDTKEKVFHVSWNDPETVEINTTDVKEIWPVRKFAQNSEFLTWIFIIKIALIL